MVYDDKFNSETENIYEVYDKAFTSDKPIINKDLLKDMYKNQTNSKNKNLFFCNKIYD
ncbi:hypothetical protein [Spiroplasma clarkii]|uniref:hypothetical protein n=1 Tax=Spiroplasma clarkii TaxID=2139 RepID=UPI001649EF6D|nr:hypothetical protein [Spiroplasma clarkii]